MTMTTIPSQAQFARDILCLALNGGINYWAAIRHLKIVPGRHGDEYDEAEVAPRVLLPGTDWTCLTHAAIIDACARIVKGEVDVSREISDSVAFAMADCDAAEIDAPAADAIVQVVVFDRVVFP